MGVALSKTIVILLMYPEKAQLSALTLVILKCDAG
jgi:hypothetical protein